MTLAYPYFVSLGKVCFINEAEKRITLVADFKNQLPRNAFTVSYAGADEKSVYFVMNGRVFPTGESGYVNVIALNKIDHVVTVRPLLVEVPGFSAAMYNDGKQLWVTTWMGRNQVYRLGTAYVLQLIKTQKFYRLGDVAVKTYENFEGLSGFVLKNENDFLYFNKDQPSYLVNISNPGKTSATPKTVQNSCEPFLGYKNGWLLLCSGDSIVLE
jgi:hypothetical protein